MKIQGYDFFMAPLEKMELGVQRQRLLPYASGNILEIGTGTGANLNLYRFSEIEKLTLTDYEESDILKQKYEQHKNKEKIEILRVDSMDIPFPDKTFDTVVSTLVFCSVEDPLLGLEEIKRVLKDDGKLIYIEHVVPEKTYLKVLTDLLTPAWKKIAGNCHLNRDFEKTLREAGLKKSEDKRFFRRLFISGIAEKAD